MAVSSETLDEILKGCTTLADVSSLHMELLQRMINRSLEAEMEAHLGYAKHQKTERGESGSHNRNGHTRKTIQSTHGGLTIDTPRDRVYAATDSQTPASSGWHGRQNHRVVRQRDEHAGH
jgi:transposase-like protein